MGLSSTLQQLLEQEQVPMVFHPTTISILAILFFSGIFYLLRKHNKKSNDGSNINQLNLPPCPPKIPVIGNIHQLGPLLHQSFYHLSNKYGPLMLLALGKRSMLIVSSAEMATQIVKNHDLIFANRLTVKASRVIFCAGNDIALAPYGDYWRKVRKFCVLELLSIKRVQSFKFIREEEVDKVLSTITQSSKQRDTINLSEILFTLSNTIIFRCSLGDNFNKEHTDRFMGLIRKAATLLESFSFEDIFPLLKWMDNLTGFNGKLRRTSQELDVFFNQVIDDHLLSKSQVDQNDQDKDDKRNLMDLLLLHAAKDNLDLTRDNIKGIILNLPKYVAEDNLRDFFSQKGEVTDAKLMRIRDGKSRQFAFIGFRTEQQAEEALKYFNNSYMDTSRITCEIAHKVGDANIPRPWSRHSVTKKEETVDESKKTTKCSSNKGELKKNKKDMEIDDPQLREFLEVMQPRSKTKLWGNDTLGSTLTAQIGKGGVEKTRSDKVDKKREDPSKVKLDKHDEKENGPSDDSAKKETLVLPKTEDLSDMDYFKSKVKKDWSDSDSDSGSESEDGPNSEAEAGREVYAEEPSDDYTGEASQEKIEEEEGPPGGSDGEMVEPEDPSLVLDDAKKQILETGRLFVRNLPYTASEEDLTEIFSKFGDISEVHLVVDRDTKRSKGIAYVLYTLPEFAIRAFEELDNSIFQGRLLHILPAKQQNTSMKQDSNAGGQASKGRPKKSN
ncbi:hypothetical protein MKW98_016790 [Papaver atlanticum]|uniref:RRM domain-containing protein n=1 Tax=Papaver atlanticum TaxID=357466 RepID=A0AAD4XVS3_9MAGN|nr:hypothetical protein MKW98_016790 [Papaver atlanticum]